MKTLELRIAVLLYWSSSFNCASVCPGAKIESTTTFSTTARLYPSICDRCRDIFVDAANSYSRNNNEFCGSYIRLVISSFEEMNGRCDSLFVSLVSQVAGSLRRHSRIDAATWQSPQDARNTYEENCPEATWPMVKPTMTPTETIPEIVYFVNLNTSITVDTDLSVDDVVYIIETNDDIASVSYGIVLKQNTDYFYLNPANTLQLLLKRPMETEMVEQLVFDINSIFSCGPGTLTVTATKTVSPIYKSTMSPAKQRLITDTTFQVKSLRTTTHALANRKSTKSSIGNSNRFATGASKEGTSSNSLSLYESITGATNSYPISMSSTERISQQALSSMKRNVGVSIRSPKSSKLYSATLIFEYTRTWSKDIQIRSANTEKRNLLTITPAYINPKTVLQSVLGASSQFIPRSSTYVQKSTFTTKGDSVYPSLPQDKQQTTENIKTSKTESFKFLQYTSEKSKTKVLTSKINAKTEFSFLNFKPLSDIINATDTVDFMHTSLMTGRKTQYDRQEDQTVFIATTTAQSDLGLAYLNVSQNIYNSTNVSIIEYFYTTIKPSTDVLNKSVFQAEANVTSSPTDTRTLISLTKLSTSTDVLTVSFRLDPAIRTQIHMNTLMHLFETSVSSAPATHTNSTVTQTLSGAAKETNNEEGFYRTIIAIFIALVASLAAVVLAGIVVSLCFKRTGNTAIHPADPPLVSIN